MLQPDIIEITNFSAGIATVVLVIVLIWQTRLLRRQLMQTDTEMKYAYAPFISPRYLPNAEGRPILHLENIGNGSAKDVYITVKDTHGTELYKMFRFAFKPTDQPHPTNVDLILHHPIIIEASYKDLADKEYNVQESYSFPNV